MDQAQTAPLSDRPSARVPRGRLWPLPASEQAAHLCWCKEHSQEVPQQVEADEEVETP